MARRYYNPCPVGRHMWRFAPLGLRWTWSGVWYYILGSRVCDECGCWTDRVF